MQVEVEDVVVTLTPAQAQHLAGTLRLELAMRWEEAAFEAVPCREEIERARSLLDSYAEQLETLCWGEPAGEVRVRWEADRVSGLVADLRQAADECVQDGTSGRRAEGMRATAAALAAALTDDRERATA